MSKTTAQVTTCFYLLMEIGCCLHVLFVLIFIIYLFIYSKRCQQKQVEPTTCFYLLMEIVCWLHVLFVLIFIIYLFIYSKRCQQKQVKATTCFYLLMEITSCETWFSFEYSVFIYLFIESDVNKSRWNWWPLFTYGNHLLWDMVFVWIFIIYLFIYSKRCQQKQVELTTFITYANHLLWDMVFFLIFSMYLFIYSKRCHQKQVELTCFYLLMQIGYS